MLVDSVKLEGIIDKFGFELLAVYIILSPKSLNMSVIMGTVYMKIL